MAIISFWGHEGAPIMWNGVQVFGRSFHPYGQDIMHSHSLTWRADAMISLMDAWVVDTNGLMGTRWLAYFPIDHEPLPRAIHDAVAQAYSRITMSKFGSKQMDNAGLDYTYIPHGVDTDVFKPLDPAESREACKLPKDKYIVGMVAANKGNPPRKAFHQNIMAFAALQKKYGDCVLYLHTIDGTRGGYESVDLTKFLDAIGLTYGYAFGRDDLSNVDVIFADQYGLALGYDDSMMAKLYSSMDVHMLVSMGEGFGIPILEAQACGTPVIVGDWTSMSELCFSGYKVAKSDADPIFTNIAAFQYLPRSAAIADCLERSYRNRGVERYRRWAREGALEYDADRVTENYWLPYLKTIEEKITQEQEVIARAKAIVSPAAEPECRHEWGGIGQFDKDGCLYAPCLKCNDALKRNKDKSLSVVKDYYKLLDGLDFAPDTDGITKIVSQEIRRDYQLDDFDIQPGDTILDIGAHKGIVSCYLAKKYPQARVIAFEPVKENYAVLIENVTRNNLTNITAHNKAVTKDGRDVQITAAPANNSGGANIYGTGETVNSLTLDSIFDFYEIDKLALLKIDCEGAEYEIFGSANGRLSNVSALRGEFHRSFGDADALLERVRAEVPDVVVTMQG